MDSGCAITQVYKAWQRRQAQRQAATTAAQKQQQPPGATAAAAATAEATPRGTTPQIPSATDAFYAKLTVALEVCAPAEGTSRKHLVESGFLFI